MMSRGQVWAGLVLLTGLAFAVSPWLVPGFNGFEPDQFPVPQDNPPVQPAGYAFAIWGVIYVWLLVSAVFGLVSRADAPDWQDMRPALTVSLAVGATWLAVATQNPLGATVLIWVMLISALVALARAPRLDRWYARGPIALYAGWLTAASSVAVGFVLGGYDILPPQVAALVSLNLAIVIGFVTLFLIPNIAEYGVSLAWALVGVIVNNGADAPIVTAFAAGGALFALALGLRSALR